jgi:hypothetical protein
MKTNTITYHSAHNYGAVLQAYALQQTILSLGIDNHIIDYASENNRIFVKLSNKKVRQMISEIYTNFIILYHLRDMKMQYSHFESFIHNDLFLTRNYCTYEELIQNPPKAECYITGSDQVWNVINGPKQGFFLEFANEEVRTVSYAASMGSYDIKQENKESLIKLIEKFDKISVREQGAKDFIEKNSKKKACVNIDPVFLLSKDKWDEVCSKASVNGKYILCYPLLHNQILNDAVQKLKQLTGYTVVVITPNARTYVDGDIIIRSAGPKEFLRLFKDAEYVLTSSFHGTAFSIINEKKFFSFINSRAPSRITSILKSMGLENRTVRKLEDINLDDIDYDSVNVLKEKEIVRAIEYLKELKDHNEQN